LRAAAALLGRDPVPGVTAGLAGLGYGLELPQFLAGLGVEGDDKAAAGSLAGEALHDHAVGRERPAGRTHVRPVGQRHVPHLPPRAGVERHEMIVRGRGEQLVAPQRESLLRGQRRAFGQAALVDPQVAPVGGVERVHAVAVTEHVEHPVAHERLVHVDAGGQGLRPTHAQLGYVAGVDLPKR